MISKQLYPETTRLPLERKWQITEKIDGQNLSIGSINIDGEPHLFYATREQIFLDNELDQLDGGTYIGLKEFHEEKGEWLLKNLYFGSVLFCEWCKGKNGSYGKDIFYYGKGRLVSPSIHSLEELKLDKKYINYHIDQLAFPFAEAVIPEFFTLPTVFYLEVYPTVEILDKLYDEYSLTLPNRYAEGFVVYDGHTILKYVRRKRGKLKPHTDKK